MLSIVPLSEGNEEQVEEEVRIEEVVNARIM